MDGDPVGSRDSARRLSREELERVRARDSEALGILFDRCFDRVYALARRLTGDESSAEDVTQDVFLKVHRSAHTLDPDRDPAPWLATITYNACKERWRSKARREERRAVPIDEAPEPALPPGAADRSPEAALLAKERDERVARAVGKLPESLRTVLVLHEYEGLAHTAIAEIVGLRETAVRKRYSRALAELRESLEDLLR